MCVYQCMCGVVVCMFIYMCSMNLLSLACACSMCVSVVVYTVDLTLTNAHICMVACKYKYVC